jgi:hypothetical protein
MTQLGPPSTPVAVRYGAVGEDFGEGGRPVEGFGVDRRVADEAVAFADGVVEFSSSCQASQKRMRALRWGSLRAARS